MNAHHHITAHDVRQRMREEGGINTVVAVFLTKHVGTMYVAYSFAVLALFGLLAILGILPPIVALLVAWTSQSFIQLVMLPVIMVGQGEIGKHQEMVSEQSFHDIEQIMAHLDAQDQKILTILQRFDLQDGEILKIVQRLEAR